MLRRLPGRAVCSTLLGLGTAFALWSGLVVAGPSNPASAVVPWTPSVPVAGTATAVGLAVDADGVSHVVFDRGDGVFYREVAADGTRSPRVRLSTASRVAHHGSVTDLGDGRVLAVWTEKRRRSDSVIVSKVVADGTPGPREIVVAGPIAKAGPSLGRARVAVVPGSSGTPDRVLVTWINYNFGSVFDLRARDLDPSTGEPMGEHDFALAWAYDMDDQYTLAADPDSGAISAVYSATQEGPPQHLTTVTLPAGTNEADDPVDVTTTTPSDPDLVLAPDGTLVTGWTDGDGTSRLAHVATVDPDTGAVLHQAEVSAPGAVASQVDLALDSTGTLTAGWRSGADEAWVRRVDLGAGGALSPLDQPVRIGTGAAPRLVVDTADQVTALVQQTTVGRRPVAVRIAPDGTVGTPRFLLPYRPGDAASGASVHGAADDDPRLPTLVATTDAEGRVHAAWSGPDFGLQLSVSDLPGAAAVPAATYVRKAPAKKTRSTKAVFVLGTDAVDASVEYLLDDGDWTPAPSRRVTLSGLSAGRHDIALRVTDSDGTGPDPTPATYRWKITP